MRRRRLVSISSSSSPSPWVGGALACLRPRVQYLALRLADRVWVQLEAVLHLHDQRDASVPQLAAHCLLSGPLHHCTVILKAKDLLHVTCARIQAWLDRAQNGHRRDWRLAAKQVVECRRSRRRGLDALLDRREVEGLERHGACGVLDVVR